MTWDMFSARQAGRAALMLVVGTGLVVLGGCSSAKPEYEYPEQIGGSDQHDPLGRSTNSDEEVGSLLDDDGLIGGLMKSDGGEEEESQGSSERQKTAKTEKRSRKSKGERKKAQSRADGKVQVNSFLWRATLETLSFMPLSSADPYGGVIISEWQINPQAPQERLKVTVYILSRELRADGIRVNVFRQVRSEAGTWVNQPPPAETQTQIESAILTRARQLYAESREDD